MYFLFYTLTKLSWHDFSDALVGVDLTWVAFMAIALFASMLLRSIRWQVIAALPLGATSKVWQASCVGYMGSAIYPAKAGELLKIICLQQLTGLKHSEVVMSSLFDRILDAIALVLLIIFISVQNPHFNLLAKLPITVLSLVLVFMLLIFYALGTLRLAAFFKKLALKHAVGKWFYAVYQQILTGMRLLKLQRLLLPCLILQTLITLLDVLACWLLFYAFGWTQLSALAAMTMLVCLAAVFCLPATPGYIGVYQVAAIFALAFFGINESKAVAYGTVFQVIALLLSIGVGVQSQLNQVVQQRRRK